MSVNSLIIKALASLSLPITVGENPEEPSDTYLVLIPLYDAFPISADDHPTEETEEVEIALYTKSNYLKLRDQITKLLIAADLTIIERRYITYESDTGFHHYSITVMGAHSY